jgi:hypothetical protein
MKTGSKWIAWYPFVTCIGKFIDNCAQAKKGCMTKTKRWSMKTGRTEEYNRQFRTMWAEGYSGKSSEKGKINTINQWTTSLWWRCPRQVHWPQPPLGSAMNSSLKQLLPSGVSLNECLLKGIPALALADMCAVMQGIREHKKHFQKISPSFISAWRLVRQPSMWREFSVDLGQSHNARTAKRFSEKSNRRPGSCVDDAKGGALSKEAFSGDINRHGWNNCQERIRLQGVSDDLMNWELLVSSGELRKVLGLRRYAEKEISLDVKISYDKKKKAASCTEDNGDLRCITRSPAG